MANTKEEYWDVEGTSLNTYAYNIEALTGTEGIPPRRGENPVIPFATGRQYVPKIADQRALTLAMWVNDETVDGVEPATDQARRAQLNDNIAAIKALFGVYGATITITRRLRLGTGLVTYHAEAECVGVLPFTWEEDFNTYAKVVVDLVMPDPYWYDGSNNPHL